MIERDKQSAHSLEQPAPAEPENAQSAAGRRRFLKGLSVGLPAVMTLRSGALMAASSSQCVAKGAYVPPNPPAFNVADAWVRGPTGYPLYTVDVVNPAETVSAVLIGSDYYLVSDGQLITSYSNPKLVGTTYYPLMYVNTQGQFQAYEPYTPPAGQYGVTLSCYTSFQ